jgi:thiol-disulfide isomerase/thioredoxin
LQQVLAAGDKDLVCVYFTASWCGPCKKMAPIVDALSVKHKSVKFVKVGGFHMRGSTAIDCLQVDVDALREIAEDSSVESVPTFALYRPNPIEIHSLSVLIRSDRQVPPRQPSGVRYRSRCRRSRGSSHQAPTLIIDHETCVIGSKRLLGCARKEI